MTVGIYCIEHIESGKKYIGKSINIKTRLKHHKCYLTSETCNTRQTNRYLYAAVQKYGWVSFKTWVVEELELDDKLMADREVYWIEFYNTTDKVQGYNLTKDSSSKCIVSDDTRALLSAKLKGRVLSEESRRKQADSIRGENHHYYGRHLSEEHKRKLSEATSGSKNPRFGKPGSMLGRKHTPEALAKMSLAQKGENHPMWGKHHSESAKIKMSLAGKGVKLSDDAIANISEGKSKFSYEMYSKEMVLLQTFARASDFEGLGFSSSAVSRVCSGLAEHHRGYIWKKIPKIEKNE